MKNTTSLGAPVLICTLSRADHFIRCMNSLNLCDGSEKTVVFIGLDFPRNELDNSGHKKIVNFLANNNLKFKQIIVVKRNENFGVNKNWSSMIEMVFDRYDRLILSEDDNEFSIDFLNFVNQGLENFKNDKKVFSVSGYGYPVDFDNTELYYTWKGFSGWGVGIWKNKWVSIKSDSEALKDIENFLLDVRKSFSLFKYSSHYLSALNVMVRNRVVHGDSYVIMKQCISNQVSVFPFKSRVRNNGHDGSGVNCMISNKFGEQIIYTGDSNYLFKKEVEINASINNKLYNYFFIGKKQYVKELVKYFLFVMNSIFSLKAKNIE